MAKVSGPLLSSNASGRAGVLCYHAMGPSPFVHAKSTPTHSDLASATRRRRETSLIGRQWATLTPAQKAAWNAAAAPGLTGWIQFLIVSSGRQARASALPTTVGVTSTAPTPFHLKITWVPGPPRQFLITCTPPTLTNWCFTVRFRPLYRHQTTEHKRANLLNYAGLSVFSSRYSGDLGSATACLVEAQLAPLYGAGLVHRARAILWNTGDLFQLSADEILNHWTKP